MLTEFIAAATTKKDSVEKNVNKLKEFEIKKIK